MMIFLYLYVLPTILVTFIATVNFIKSLKTVFGVAHFRTYLYFIFFVLKSKKSDGHKGQFGNLPTKLKKVTVKVTVTVTVTTKDEGQFGK